MTFSKDRKPNVPPGWIARWDDERKKWYYGKLTIVPQWEAPNGTYFPPESESSFYEQTGNGTEEVSNQDLGLNLSQQQDGYITSQKYQKLSQSDTLESSPVESMEMDEDKTQNSWIDIAKCVGKGFGMFVGCLALTFGVPFLIGTVLMFFVRILVAIARKLR